MKEKLFLAVGFFTLVPVLIVTESFLLKRVSSSLTQEYMSPIASISVSAEEAFPNFGSVFNPAPDFKKGGQVKGSVVAADARPILIRDYLAKYNSPLLPYSDLIFEVSQKYGLDFRLIVAIAQQESNLCKKAPPNCFNCWGVGIHSRGKMCFNSYEEAIEWFARYLKEEYLDKGLTTPEEMMTKYCPLSNGSWAFGLRQFMGELE